MDLIRIVAGIVKLSASLSSISILIAITSYDTNGRMRRYNDATRGLVPLFLISILAYMVILWNI